MHLAFYSHEAVGLGHVRRNLLLAQAILHANPNTDILMLTGAKEAAGIVHASGIDCVSLPALRKERDGRYSPRHLHLSLDEIINLRSQIMAAALKAFEPDLFIVDKLPRGIFRELDPVLQCLRGSADTRTVLGLRDILDDPEVVRREWAVTESTEAIRDLYDAVWVYGDPAVYDVRREYELPDLVSRKLSYTGYLDQTDRIDSKAHRHVRDTVLARIPDGPLALCMVGGGEDGAPLAEAFARAELPAGIWGLIVTGPFMPAEFQHQIHEIAAQRKRLDVIERVDEPSPLVERADRIVAMGGYGTVSEILSYEKHALIVPRVRPRREQMIRAARLSAMGLLDMLHPADLSPRAITEWLSASTGPDRIAKSCIDFGGLHDVVRLVDDLSRQDISCASGCGVVQRTFFEPHGLIQRRAGAPGRAQTNAQDGLGNGG